MTSSPRRHIALVAHDNKKVELLEWAAFNAGTLAHHHLFDTGTTKFLSGPVGGDQPAGAGAAAGGSRSFASRPAGNCVAGCGPWARRWP
jgi:methylglyoxal synthase